MCVCVCFRVRVLPLILRYLIAIAHVT